jgi:hypothetical protein
MNPMIIEKRLPTHSNVISGDAVNAPTPSANTLVNAEIRMAGPVSART